MRRRTWRAIAVACLAATGAGAADGPCVADARRLCPDVPVGEGRILACFRARWYEVSSACQQVVQDVEGRARQIGAACSGDVWQYCRNVPPGQGRLLSCVSARWNDLSSTCRDAVGAVTEKIQRFQDACANDAARLCPGVPSGGGKIYACLKLYEGSLSSACRSAMRP